MKYPKTPHLPWSKNISSDDKIIKSLDELINHKTVITEKLDGGNACLTKNNVFARTHSTKAKHESFDWLKQQHAMIADSIPEEYLVFGENMYAVHSIFYNQLKSYFYIFAVYDNRKKLWLSFDEVKKISEKLNFPYVPVLWKGSIEDNEKFHNLVTEIMSNGSCVGGEFIEGIVVRKQSSFKDREFMYSIAKWVRKNHIQTNRKWKANWTKNKLI